MTTRRSTTLLTAAGLSLVALAPALHFAAVPVLAKLPADATSTVEYVGSTRALDSKTMQLGQAVPVTAAKTVQVISTQGDTAVISSTSTLHTPAGDTTDPHTYAVDRGDYSQATPPTGVKVEDQKGGIVLSRPIDPGTHDFTVYDALTHSAVPVGHASTSKVAGRTVYVFEGSATAPVTSPEILAKLQGSIAALTGGNGTAVPKAMLRGLATTLSEDKAAELHTLLGRLPDEVPLAFLSTSEYDVAVDTELGTPLHTAQEQTIVVALDLGKTTVPLLTVGHTELAQTAESSQSAADAAASADRKLTVVDTWLPLCLGAAAIVLLVLALRRRGRDAAPSSGANRPVESVTATTV